jgi:8-oxo-dGTP diphosphatase
VINVSCAIIIDELSKVFVAQRNGTMSLPLKWEFPGGKVEESETPESCLIREIKEELGVDIDIVSALPPNKHDYPTITINLIPFVCKIIDGEVVLREHASFKWLNSNELINLDWADADKPILYHYLNSVNAA